MEAKMFGLVRRDVMNLAYQLAVKNNITHTFLAKEVFLEGSQNFLFDAQRELHLPGLKDLIKEVSTISLTMIT